MAPARDRGEETLLGLYVGGERPKQRRLGLAGAVRAAKTLDGSVGFPACFQQIVDTQPLVFCGEVGMVAASGAAGIGKHEDALLVVHEGLCLGEIRGGNTRPDSKTVDAVT
jgi:hypothetical protein